MTDPEIELDQNRRMCASCKSCKRKPRLHYEPGVTWLTCGCDDKPKCTAIDWNPKQAREEWNKRNSK